jgi:Bacterial mobilisation protein (MobC)
MGKECSIATDIPLYFTFFIFIEPAESSNSSIKIRLSKEKKFSWQEKAVRAGITLSTFIREAMSRTRTWTAGVRASLAEKTRQISRIGNNLNQIAK